MLLALKSRSLRTKLPKISAYSLFAVGALAILNYIFNLGTLFVSILGRDMTFTGRTSIWQALLNEKTNPLFGVGFYSFWLGDRVERLSEKYFYHLNEAHNGYLETYLNTGLIGLFLLVCLIIFSIRRLRSASQNNHSFIILRISIIYSTVLYNITEAVFDRMDIVWMAFLLALIKLPNRESPARLTDEMDLPWVLIPEDKLLLPST
jgi:O-antigen ligase